uniref:SFRICE_010540 n=1 Tax=Spodoptera frugiperda TaxID=7108 RepID=A0A2H1VLF7_SPOFR
MADKTKISAVTSKTTVKPKRPTTVSVPTTSRTKIVSKDNKNVPRTKKTNANMTTVDPDATILKLEQQGFPDFDAEHRQIAYGKFLRAMLEECLVDEKIEREETVIDLQMSQLADRFQKTMDQLDKTSRRLKNISFVAEQKRLLDLKGQVNTQIFDMTEKSNANKLLEDLHSTEQRFLDKIELKNVDFGYNNVSGHKQLLDAVNDAIDGLEQIKKDSNLDLDKFKEYEKSQMTIEELEKDRFDLESLKSDFETKFPRLSEQLFKEASERIAKIIDNDDGDGDGDVDD